MKADLTYTTIVLPNGSMVYRFTKVATKLSLSVTQRHALAAFRGVKEQLNNFFTWELSGVGWSVSFRGRFNHRKMDVLQKCCGCSG
jgi:hypothetical protein